MGSEFVELSSSDEGEDAAAAAGKRSLEQSIDDEDEVVIIDRSQCSSFSHSRKLHKVFIDPDDCCIVEPAPNSRVLDVVQTTDVELVVTGEVGPVACRDFPHARHLCARFIFGETAHESCCEQCHCYVCDKLAPCESWVSHCHASDKEDHWRILRKAAKLPSPLLYKAPVVSYTPAYAPPPGYRPRGPAYTFPRPSLASPRTMGDFARAVTAPRTIRTKQVNGRRELHSAVGLPPLLSTPRAPVFPPASATASRVRGHLVLKNTPRPPAPRPVHSSVPRQASPVASPLARLASPTHHPVPSYFQPAFSSPASVSSNPPAVTTTRATPATTSGATTRAAPRLVYTNSTTTTTTRPATGAGAGGVIPTSSTRGTPSPSQTRSARPKKQARRRGVTSAPGAVPPVQVPACSISTAATLDPSPAAGLRSPTEPIAQLDMITGPSPDHDSFFAALFDAQE